jgi:hypothetical protein
MNIRVVDLGYGWAMHSRRIATWCFTLTLRRLVLVYVIRFCCNLNLLRGCTEMSRLTIFDVIWSATHEMALGCD